MEAGQSSKQYGRELLESILNDGTAASTSKDTGASSAVYFTSRVEGRRLQLGNQDRSRPVARIDTLAHHQIQKRDKRVLKKKTKNGTLHQYEKGKQREERKPMSRRQRQRQGLDTMDDQLSFETLEPIHQLWLDYIHRFMGFIDENGLIQTNNHFSIVHERNGQPHISLNANAINSFQSSIVKADFCGAPIKSEFVISLPSITHIVVFINMLSSFTVIRALNPSLVGIEGLIAKETNSTFVIVTRSRLPKAKKNSRTTKSKSVIPFFPTFLNAKLHSLLSHSQA